MKLAFWSCLSAAVLTSTAALAESARSGAYTLELIGASGRRLPTYRHDGRTYVLGGQGERYSLRIRNNSADRIEVVASVDGRDVLDGQPSQVGKNGYVVNGYSEVVIDGFRLSHEAVAAFRFSSVRNSYASRMGDARDVGVVGAAIFTERRHIEYPQYSQAPDDFEGAEADKAPSPPSATGAAGTAAAEPAPAPARASNGMMDRAEAKAAPKKEPRGGLGTAFGEQRSSHVDEVQFERDSSNPSAVLTLRYDDRQGLLAMGVNLGPSPDEVGLRQTAEPFRRDPQFSTPPPGWRD